MVSAAKDDDNDNDNDRKGNKEHGHKGHGYDDRDNRLCTLPEYSAKTRDVVISGAPGDCPE